VMVVGDLVMVVGDLVMVVGDLVAGGWGWVGRAGGGGVGIPPLLVF
jgi:hypothetical protein